MIQRESITATSINNPVYANRKMKTFLKAILPPFILRLIQRKSRSNRYMGSFSSWKEANTSVLNTGLGYAHSDILNKVLTASLEVKAGRASFERDSVLFYEEEYRWPLLSALLYVTKENEQNCILDFGGSLGSCYFQHRKMLRFQNIRWHIVEQPGFVKAGKKFIEDECLKFFENIEEAVETQFPNICLLNSVLQYIEDPFGLISKIHTLGVEYVFIDLTPFSNNLEDTFTIQFVSKEIYEGHYPIRVFSTSNFEKKISKNWKIIARISGGYPSDVWNKSFVEFKGFFIRRRDDWTSYE